MASAQSAAMGAGDGAGRVSARLMARPTCEMGKSISGEERAATAASLARPLPSAVPIPGLGLVLELGFRVRVSTVAVNGGRYP